MAPDRRPGGMLRMSDRDYSLKALNEFLDYLSSKHLLNKNTAQSRKAAVNKVFSVLDEKEARDLSAIELDMVFRRFENKAAKDYKPDSLMVYRSRVGSAINDFFSYVENPAQFRPSLKNGGSTSTRKAGKPARKTDEQQPGYDLATQQHKQTGARTNYSHANELSVPVPLREGVLVQITGLPADLTEGEASRLAAIVKAYAVQ